MISLSQSESPSSLPYIAISSLVWVPVITGLGAVPDWPADPVETQNPEKEKCSDRQKQILLPVPSAQHREGRWQEDVARSSGEDRTASFGHSANLKHKSTLLAL